MSKSRFLLSVFLKLCIGAACLVGAIAAYRFLHPLIESAFSLGEHASSIVRRVNIFVAVILSYWAFVRYYERRAAQELSLPWRWVSLAAVAGAMSARSKRCTGSAGQGHSSRHHHGSIQQRALNGESCDQRRRSQKSATPSCRGDMRFPQAKP